MIQQGSFLTIIDNSGAKEVSCIKVRLGYKSRYAYIGDVIIGSIKTLRSKRRVNAKVKKGEIVKALIVRTQTNLSTFSGDSLKFFKSSAVILNKNNKFLGTRIFGVIPKIFRQTKYLKICSLSLGLVS